MVAEARRAGASFTLRDAQGTVRQDGSAEAVVGDDVLSVGPVSVAWLDAERVLAADYRIDIELWPSGRLTLRDLGRRYETFVDELRRVRSRARVAGLLAHGVTMPAVFPGAVLLGRDRQPAEIQVFDTHVTIAPADGDPWQVPLGAVTAIRTQDDPPAILLDTSRDTTTIGQLARQREACLQAIASARAVQSALLLELTGERWFSDGLGVEATRLGSFDRLIERFTVTDRVPCCRELLAHAHGDPLLGFVRLLDPDGERLEAPVPLPEHWAAFLLVPVVGGVVLEVLAGPSAATYVFRGQIEDINRDLQALHFRRAPLALTASEAVPSPTNPHRLALRKLEPLKRLRAATVARVVHNDGWERAVREALERGPLS